MSRDSHRARRSGIDRLVALSVPGLRRMADVGRQRHFAMALEQRRDVRGEAHPVELAFPALNSHSSISYQDIGTHGRRVAGADERQGLARAEHALDEELDLASARLPAGEPRLDDARIVQHEEVALVDQPRQVGELQVLERPAARVQVQQAARRSLRCGVLGDELRRQRIVELGHAHRANYNFHLPTRPEWRNR